MRHLYKVVFKELKQEFSQFKRLRCYVKVTSNLTLSIIIILSHSQQKENLCLCFRLSGHLFLLRLLFLLLFLLIFVLFGFIFQDLCPIFILVVSINCGHHWIFSTGFLICILPLVKISVSSSSS